MRRLHLAAVTALTLSLSLAGMARAGGPPGIGFYVDGELYRTLGTPTDFSGTGAPGHSFDTIYVLGGELRAVAEAKPGDPDFNGGRWVVIGVTWHVTPYQITDAEGVLAAEDAGHLTIAATPMRWFECPVIPLGGAG